MTNIAWRNLAGERTRFAISVAAVAFSALLVLTLRGLYTGVIDEATRYVRTAGADLWVAQGGIPPDFLQATSVLPAAERDRVAAVLGVAQVAPLLSRAVAFRLGDRQGDLYLLGVDPSADIGWPATGSGNPVKPRPGEIIVDRVFAKHFDVEVGDTLAIGGSGLKVARVSGGGNAFVYQLGWANIGDVSNLVAAGGSVSYFLVRTDTGQNQREVARRITADVPGTQVFTGQDLADKNAENLKEGFLPILWVLMLVTFVVGTAIIGLVIYTATVEKVREYGILKAIGFSNRRLYAVVFQQSLMAGTTGFVFGCLLSFALAPLIQQVVPVFVTHIRVGDIVFVGFGAVLMSLLASFVPARPVTRLDPAEVFKH